MEQIVPRRLRAPGANPTGSGRASAILYHRALHAIQIAMRGTGKSQPNEDPPPPMSWTDALILGGAILGLLIGASLLSFQLSAVLGVMALAFVIYKLLTTKP